MKVRYTKGARQNLEDLVAYIVERNPAAGRRVGRRIQEVIDLLATRPALGPPGRAAGTRELKIPGLPYRVIYRVAGVAADVLEVLRIQHVARRDWPPDWE